MNEIRKASQRGHAEHGWLNSSHSFSFADYHDPSHMGFGPLRVINEDRVAPGKGFGAHSHRDMEIISYVLSGALAHKDNIGNGSVLHYGDVQRMSAGKGVTHSEFNESSSAPVHFLQIWIMPDVRGAAPGYEEKRFDPADQKGRLRLIASADGADGSVVIRQDAKIFAAILDGDDTAICRLAAGRLGYVHVARGALEVNAVQLSAGDALKVTDEDAIALGKAHEAEVLVFDLPR